MLVVLNNKCHFTKDGFKSYVKELYKIKTVHQLVLCPSAPFLPYIKRKKLIVGSQDVSSYSKGAYTGEVSAIQLNSLEVKYCLVGHAERRMYQKETNQEINLKIKNLLENDIMPILCVGEEHKESDIQKVIELITKQIQEATMGIDEKEKIIIAYEPIWSIGSGNIIQIKDLELIVQMIKKKYSNYLVLYGGSITSENIKEINQYHNIDGFLLGRVSLDSKTIKQIINQL